MTNGKIFLAPKLCKPLVAGNMFLIGIIEVAVKTPEKKHTVGIGSRNMNILLQKQPGSEKSHLF